MERVTDVLNNIYNTGMSFQENQRKKRQEGMQGRQFALNEAVKRAELGNMGYEMNESQGGPYGTQFKLQKTGQFQQSYPGFVNVGGVWKKDPLFQTPLEKAQAELYTSWIEKMKPEQANPQQSNPAQQFEEGTVVDDIDEQTGQVRATYIIKGGKPVPYGGE